MQNCQLDWPRLYFDAYEHLLVYQHMSQDGKLTYYYY